MSDAPRCVHCRVRPAVPRWRPFCSERCKMADLGQWLSGGYRIEGAPAEPTLPEIDGDEDEPDRSDG
jgi:endogenous inhibitor of DNA gyrase (YacG/DUF329 family)